MSAVVLDTDIGGDIDDTWALAMLCRYPELDLRLVTTVTGDTTYRAGIVAGILSSAGRDDVPIGIGIPTTIDLPEHMSPRPQGEFADELDLDSYRGGIHSDGVHALVDCVMGSSEPVTVIGIGPMTNIAAALALEPRIAEKARLVGMLGWVRDLAAGDGPMHGAPAREYNVAADVAACRAAFEANWEITITPIDTCGTVILRGARFSRVRDAGTPLTQALMRNYAEWARAVGAFTSAADYGDKPEDSGFWERRSSVLFDTVAVYLAYDESLLNIEQLPIEVDDDGLTRIMAGARELRVATSWRNREGFEEQLVERLTMP
jgi:inosine-uridine nucleoside N-ribohydrolase